MICSWMDEDFGIDATVEIMRPIPSSRNEFATGKRFSVQLKSTDSKDFYNDKIPLSVPREKITYWYNSIEPVLITLINLKEKEVYYKWINNDLIEHLFSINPNWIANTSVTLHFEKGQTITPTTLIALESYVVNWKRPQKTVLSPGSYFKFNRDASTYIKNIHDTTLKFGVNFLQNEVEELNRQLSKTIYTIAIAGPSRSGKSTLINALLHKEISPIGIFPTTGVPITIIPKEDNSALIVFKDGATILGNNDSSFIEQFTSQEKNPDNIKKVKLVSVHVTNDLLEKGFALCDIPGLDDPNDEIRAISKTAIYNVNAIIYVINAAPMRDGGFSLTKQIVDDLKELGGKVDKLFLVFNKVDELNNTQIDQLSNYVNSSLSNYDILKYLPSEPHYLSSKVAFEKRKKGKPDIKLEKLELDIWTFLLSNNKTGLNKLLGSYGDLKTLLEKLQNIINTRLLDLNKRTELVNEIVFVENEITQLHNWVNIRSTSILESFESLLSNSLDNVLYHMKIDLASRPLTESLPSNAMILQWLENNLLNIISGLQGKLQNQIRGLQTEINSWIATKLKQVELTIEAPQETSSYQMPDLKEYINQINPTFQDEDNSHPGMLETVLLVFGKIIEGLVEIITNALTSSDVIRTKQIERLCSKAHKSFSKIREQFNGHVASFIKTTTTAMVIMSQDRTMVYLGNLKQQLGKLQEPFSEEERVKYQHFLHETKAIENKIASDFIYLEAYTNGLAST